MILLMAAPQDGKGGGIQTLIMFGLIFVVFYFFMLRPQMKKQKEQKKFRDELKKGTKIITIGGVHGKVSEVHEDTVIIEVGNGNSLKVEKSAIAQEFSSKDLEKA